MAKQTRVLFNGECPVCSREIAHYENYAVREGLALQFEDLTNSNLADWGVDADTAARRIHVIKNGTLHVGLPAFLVIWADMPRFAVLARVLSLPGIRQLAGLTYDYILAPVLYAMHKRRIAKAR